MKSGNVTGYKSTTTTATTDNPITMTTTFYSYTAAGYFPSTIYHMIFDNPYFWLASRFAAIDQSTRCTFGVFQVFSGDLNGYNMAVSTLVEHTAGARRCVIPVVTLETNIQTTGQDDNGVWQLNVE